MIDRSARRVAAPLTFLLAIAFVAVLAGCQPAGEPPTATPPPAASETPPVDLRLIPVGFEALPGWAEDRQSEAMGALAKSCERLAKQDPSKPVGPEAIAGTVADWLPVCQAAKSIAPGDDEAARRFFEAMFRPFAVSDGDNAEGLFTGYFEPELMGARQPSAAFSVPLYAKPADLITVDLGEFRADLKGDSLAGRIVDGGLKPYFTYREIDEGALAGRGLELVWVADPVDAFFLHIQGSGRVTFPDGSQTRVGYAAKNGHKFVAIGKLLIERGEISKDRVSMQSIRDWLRAHPDEAPALMYENPSYIFYREVTGDGPIGAQGVVLTPLRSLAVDRKLLPLGVPIWLDSVYPGETPEAGLPLQRLMIAQDTGGAIRGAVRGDVFWGTGERALDYAGRMKQKGRYYLLLPTAVAEKRPAGG